MISARYHQPCFELFKFTNRIVNDMLVVSQRELHSPISQIFSGICGIIDTMVNKGKRYTEIYIKIYTYELTWTKSF